MLDAKRGELEVVGGEEGERPKPGGKVRAGRPREGEPVVGAGPAADLVEEDKALRRRVVEDVRRLGHLDHERRASSREVVRGADAGVDPVHRADDRGLGGDEASGVGEQHDMGGLAHVGRLSAHVWAGDDEHPALRSEIEVVGHEGRLRERLHHEVPSGPDPDPGLLAQLGTAEPEVDRAVRESRQHVERGDGARARLQAVALRPRRLDHPLVELAFEGEGAFARPEHLVLELLELRREIALHGLEGLPPDVFEGDPVRARRARDLDVVAVHPVVAHLEPREPGAGALARLELGDVPLRVVADVAQAIELGVEAGGDDPAVANGERRRLDDGRLEVRPKRGEVADPGGELGGERAVDPLDPLAQRGERPEAVRSWARSRGRAVPSAIRASTRSRSPTERSRPSVSGSAPASIRAPMNCWRRRTVSRSRSGRPSQRVRSRLPIAVTVRSRTPARDRSASPETLSTTSRLRRDTGSSTTVSSRRSVRSPVTCGRGPRFVVWAYSRAQPAAPIPSSSVSHPNPLRSRVPK